MRPLTCIILVPDVSPLLGREEVGLVPRGWVEARLGGSMTLTCFSSVFPN